MLFIRFAIIILTVYRYIILISALLTWFPVHREHGFRKLVKSLSDPYISFFRKHTPVVSGIDISPIVGLVILSVLIRILNSILFRMTWF